MLGMLLNQYKIMERNMTNGLSKLLHLNFFYILTFQLRSILLERRAITSFLSIMPYKFHCKTNIKTGTSYQISLTEPSKMPAVDLKPQKSDGHLLPVNCYT